MKTRVLPALRRTPAEATALEVPRPRRNQAGWVIFAVRTDSYIYDAMSSVRAGRPVSFGSAVCMCWSQGRCRTALDDRSALTQPRTRRNASCAPPSSNSRRGTSRRSAGSPCLRAFGGLFLDRREKRGVRNIRTDRNRREGPRGRGAVRELPARRHHGPHGPRTVEGQRAVEECSAAPEADRLFAMFATGVSSKVRCGHGRRDGWRSREGHGPSADSVQVPGIVGRATEDSNL